MEEYASGERSALWLIREILSAVRRPRTHETLHERRAQMLSNVWTDTRYALRTFRCNPGFAAAAMIPIALGTILSVSALARGIRRPFPGAWLGAIVAIVVVGLIAWWWFRALRWWRDQVVSSAPAA